MDRLAPMLAGVIAFVGLCYVCVARDGARIEADIATRTLDALMAASVSDPSIDVDGRDVRIAGVVPTSAARLNAESAVADLWGVGRVENQLSLTGEVEAEAEASASSRPAVTREVLTRCQSEFDRILSRGTIAFDTEDSVISGGSVPLLDDLVSAIERCPGAVIQVGGHTDSLGDDVFNRDLSEARAVAVVDYFTLRGVDSGRLRAIGFGESEPIADNATSEGRAMNRRIELRALAN